MLSKPCIACGLTKTLDEFYAHPRMKDGHLNKCKMCQCAATRKNYLEKPEEHAAYERKRFKTKHRKEKVKVYIRHHRERHPDRHAARQALSNAVRDGKVIRQPCVACGNPKSQGHHTDYAKQLDVVWMCFKCHREKGHGQTVHI